MRNINFRIRDKQLNKWMDLDTYQNMGAIEIENDGTLTLSPRFRFTQSMAICPDAFDVMQYTGLKDKNGQEIYEGDILVEYGNEIDYWTVEYSYGKFCGICDDICEDLYELSDLEVIGNIYDNPELFREGGTK